MADLNKVQLIGRLGLDPEPKGQGDTPQVARLRVATSFRRNKGHEHEKLTEWHDVVTFGELASLCCRYLQKGRLVYVEGRLTNSTWKTKSGEVRVRKEVVANRIDFLGAQSQTEGRELSSAA
ncbi:MAG TPA: single-stranded DNA-binding protein [Myxococcales bacterium]|nr:single-stranded DNA-binding protein [Myxococcales bacterium]HAN32766.1 single-stranded DNA-binding protein [Myxococcales bacterium]